MKVDIWQLIGDCLDNHPECQADYIETMEEAGYGFNLDGQLMTPEERQACDYGRMWAIQAAKETGQSLEDLLRQGEEAGLIKRFSNQKDTLSLPSKFKAPLGGKLIIEAASKELVSQLDNLAVGNKLRLHCYNLPDYPYLVIERNPKYPNLFILANENEVGEQINITKFSSTENAIYWASRCDEAIEMKETKLNESMTKGDVELYYDSLPISIYVGGHSYGYYDIGYGNWLPDEGEEKEIEVGYTYEADRTSVEECLADWYYEDHPDQEPETEEEIWKFIEDHFEELVNNYMDRLLDHFEDDAAEEAQDKDWSDYLYEGYHKENPYIFKSLQEAAEDKEGLPGFWDEVENLPEEAEEDFEEIETKYYWEDLEEPELDANPYSWDNDYMEREESNWEFVAEKDIFDEDGFLNQYVWYKSIKDPNKHIFMFNDDLPEEDQADHVCNSVSEARDWFNAYEGFPEEDFDYEADVELEEEVEEELRADDCRQFTKHSTLQEGKMKDLDLDIKNEGGKNKLISKLESDLAALESERSFLTDFAPREIGAGGAFDSREEITTALEAVEKEISLTRAKLAVLRG